MDKIFTTDNIVIYVIFSIIGIVFFMNMIKVFINIFTRPKVEVDPMQQELRETINETVRPHLTSLEGMYEKSGKKENSFSTFVFSVFKDKLSKYTEKNEKLVEKEIAKCCDDYECSECKESYCLEGAGIACPQS